MNDEVLLQTVQIQQALKSQKDVMENDVTHFLNQKLPLNPNIRFASCWAFVPKSDKP